MLWSDIPGWFTWPELYGRALWTAPPGACFVEVGSFLGRSAAFLLQSARNAGKRITLHCVDGWDGRCGDGWEVHGVSAGHCPEFGGYEGFCREYGDLALAFAAHMKGCGVSDMVRQVREHSPGAVRHFADESCRLVFIDASHDYDSVKADLKAWWPKVAPGGTFAGHDYGTAFPGVDAAVKEFFGFAPRPSEECWLVRKPVAQ